MAVHTYSPVQVSRVKRQAKKSVMRRSNQLRIETEGRESAAVFFEWVEQDERYEKQSFSSLVQHGVQLQSAAGARSGASGVESRKLLEGRKAGGWLDQSRRKPRWTPIPIEQERPPSKIKRSGQDALQTFQFMIAGLWPSTTTMLEPKQI